MASIGNKVTNKEKSLKVGATKKMYEESGAKCSYK